jgi:GNAT superfamily N-acetyltransferase
VRETIHIRKAILADAEGIARVKVDTWRTTYRGIVPDETLAKLSYDEQRARWERQLRATDGRFTYVLQDENGKVVGFASGGPVRTDDPGYAGELYAIYVLDAHQGTGWGRQLVAQVAGRLAQMGMTSMLLWTFRDNPARGFYERLGGRYLREQPLDIDGVPIMEVAYGWPDTAPLRAGGSAEQGKQMRIREACESDVEGMARVVLSADDAVRGLLPEEDFVTYEESVTNWRRCLRERASGETVLVAEERPGAIVGLAMCGPEASGDAAFRGGVYILGVLESRRRRGIGRLLVQEAAARLAQDGITSLLIWCLAINPYCAFYARLGGTVVRERPYKVNGITFTTEVAYGWPDTTTLLEADFCPCIAGRGEQDDTFGGVSTV